MTDLRWIQRFNNYKKAFAQLERIVKMSELNDIEQQGLIKAFEYTYELSWKVLQDLLKERGYTGAPGPRPVIEQSFQDGYISQGVKWLEMLKDRNLTTHTYDEETAKDVVKEIRVTFYPLFLELKERLEQEL